jgi:hypothetical protein
LPPRYDDDAERTPRQTGSWAIARDLAESCIARLDKVATVKRNPHPLAKHRDPQGAVEAEEIASELRSLLPRFDAWATDPALGTRERPILIPRLTELRRTAEAIFDRMGPGF